jgi:hypothetical protein
MTAEVKLDLEDQEIRSLRMHCPSPKENLAWLEADIVKRGPIDSVKYWASPDGKNIVIDGYNRIEICERLNINYTKQELKFGSRDEAVNYFIDAQLKRRNLTAKQIAYLNGKRYQTEKQCHGGNRSSSRDNCDMRKTGPELAAEMGIGARTLLDQAEFSNAIERISQVDPAFTQMVLGDALPTTMERIKQIGSKDKTSEQIKVETDKIIAQAITHEKQDPLSEDERSLKQFLDFDRRQTSSYKKLLDLKKITDTSAVSFDLTLETSRNIVSQIERIKAASASS